MNVESQKLKVCVFLAAILACGFFGVYFYTGGGGGGIDMVAEAAQTLPLANPTITQSALTTFLDEEAGMSVYTDVGQSLDLSKAKAEYKTIEKETSEYIVGSVSLPDLPESDDVHCFVHKNGWIVVYYLEEEPASKIIDWNWCLAGKLTKTKLQIGLDEMCVALGVTATDMNYYHFQYPYANKWMIIIDNDSFRVKIPSDFTFYERSYSHFCDSKVGYERITSSQLTPDAFHTVALVYNDYYDYDEFKVDGIRINRISSVYVGNHNIAIILLYRES